MKQNYPFLNIGLFFIQGYASVHVFLILAALSGSSLYTPVAGMLGGQIFFRGSRACFHVSLNHSEYTENISKSFYQGLQNSS